MNQPSTHLKIPLGIYSFKQIRTQNYYYVDKTYYISKLYQEGKYYFLSRPSKFGKSLLVDTIKCAFKGQKELFEGLYLEKNWDWNQKYPVIYLNLNLKIFEFEHFLESILNVLYFQFEELEIPKIQSQDYMYVFQYLVKKTYEKYKKPVVILVDEYDSPIIENLHNLPEAIAIRNLLDGLYKSIRILDEYTNFVFLTGISKISRSSLFQALNQLRDISLSKEYSTICGFTEQEILTNFSHLITPNELEIIKHWYNGYSWSDQPLYNPYSILNYLQDKKISPYWPETNNPKQIFEILDHKYFQFQLPLIEGIICSEQTINSFDVQRIVPESLLFQLGYLSIKSTYTQTPPTQYKLSLPNNEVRFSLCKLYCKQYNIPENYENQLLKTLLDEKFTEFIKLLNQIFIPLKSTKNKVTYINLFYALMVCNIIQLNDPDIKFSVSCNQPNKLTFIIHKASKIYVLIFCLDHDCQDSININQLTNDYGKSKEIILIAIKLVSNKINYWVLRIS
ncbi:MAG: AAA family ATPase [bacterium]